MQPIRGWEGNTWLCTAAIKWEESNAPTYLEDGVHTWRRRWMAKWGKAAAVDGGAPPKSCNRPN